MILRFLLSSALVAGALFAPPLVAFADEITSPVSADLVLEWQNEYRSDSDDATVDETNNSFVRAELAPKVSLGDYFFVDGVFVFEPFDQAAALNENDDIWFDREGIFVEEIKLKGLA